MNVDMTRKAATWVACSIALLAVSGLTLASQDVEERRTVNPAGMVHVINVAGDIEISAWDKAEVYLQGEIADGAELEIRESDQGIRIEVKARNGRNHHGNSDLEVRVPQGASLSVSGVSSDIMIAGMRGESVVAESTSGDVEVSAHVESVELRSISGDVIFDGKASRVRAETVSGDIELEGVSGEIEATVVSGDVIVNGGIFNRARFESVSGSIEVRMELETGGRLTAETMSGDLDFELPGTQSGEIHAQTYSGDIESAFGSPQREGRGPGSVLKYVAGADGTSIKLVSFSGDIEIAHK